MSNLYPFNFSINIDEIDKIDDKSIIIVKDDNTIFGQILKSRDKFIFMNINSIDNVTSYYNSIEELLVNEDIKNGYLEIFKLN